jgi:hypothetical protein
MSCWEQHKILSELRGKFKAICVWPPKPTTQFQVYDVLLREHATWGSFEKWGTLKRLFPTEESYNAALKDQDKLVSEPFPLESKTMRKIDWDAGLKVIGQMTPQASVEVETQGSHKGDLEFTFDHITTVRCPERGQLSEQLLQPGLLSKVRLETLNSGHVWVVVQTISVGKFECKVTADSKGLFKAKGKGVIPAGGAANVEAEVHVTGWSHTDSTLKYDAPDQPLVMAFVCLRYEIKDGKLCKPVFVAKGEDPSVKGKETEIEPEQWFEKDDSSPFFEVREQQQKK